MTIIIIINNIGVIASGFVVAVEAFIVIVINIITIALLFSLLKF